MLRFLVFAVALISAHQALANTEPSFCDPSSFEAKYKMTMELAGTKRLHGFQIGELTLIGVAIGKSDPKVLQSLAMELGGVPTSEKSCTWYLNRGNKTARALFNWYYVPHPFPWSKKNKTADKYLNALDTEFSKDATNMVKCASDYGYIAMGCDGMKHRGPSVFAMLLSYAGCDPGNANKIANQVWGLNTVPSSIRKEIAERGFKLGEQNPEARRELQRVMGEN